MSKNEFSYFNELLDVLASKVDPTDDDLICQNREGGIYVKLSGLFPYSECGTEGHEDKLLSFDREGYFGFPVFSHIDEESKKIQCYSNDLMLSEAKPEELDEYVKKFAETIDKFSKLETKLTEQIKEYNDFVKDVL